MAKPICAEEYEGEPVSHELSPLLFSVYDSVQLRPADLVAVFRAMEALLAFLSSPAGRTNANCQVTDFFFLLPHETWERGWGHLPDELQEILDDIGGQLHDTVSAPCFAANFESTPEQLLARLRNLRADE